MSETPSEQLQFDIVPTHLAVQAMRDNGYKNAAHAIAELMDNAIQAEATQVELLCGEKTSLVSQRQRSRVETIAVLDNGCGMDADTLRMALQFGNGTRLDPTQQTGIGRFGMGLPASSISQCTRVDVWTWRGGHENALHSYLDLDRIKTEGQTAVPKPEPKPIPAMWLQVGQEWGASGTLVVWSDLDRFIWRTAEAVIANSEFVIGRMYRNFLKAGTTRIRLVSFNVSTPATQNERWAQPNDPLYLMEDTSCPAPYESEPMFEPWGEEIRHVIDFNGGRHEVKLRFAVAKKDARPNDNAGGLPHGQHAKKNVGVSIMRAGRELELDQGIVNTYDSRERWWGAEIEFPPALDELFGVSNNKQSARVFADLMRMEPEALFKPGQTANETMSLMAQEDDPKAPLYELVRLIRSNVGVLRDLVKAQTKGARSGERHVAASNVEEIATAKTRERQEQGYAGHSDRDESLPPAQKQEIIEATLVEAGVRESTAHELAASTVSRGIKYRFADTALEGSAFFTVQTKAGVIFIKLNTQHPAFDKLVDVLEEDVEGVGAEELRERLTNALDGLKLLLTAWARYEDELEGSRRQNAQDARNDWGRIARDFLTTDD